MEGVAHAQFHLSRGFSHPKSASSLHVSLFVFGVSHRSFEVYGHHAYAVKSALAHAKKNSCHRSYSRSNRIFKICQTRGFSGSKGLTFSRNF